MKNSIVKKKSYNISHQPKKNLEISILLNNSVENIHYLNQNDFHNNTKINRTYKTLTLNDQKNNNNYSIITKRLSLRSLNKKNHKKLHPLTHFSGLNDMLAGLSYKNIFISECNQKLLINNVILIQRNFKKYLINKKIKRQKKISSFTDKTIKKKQLIKSVKINFGTNFHFKRIIPQKTQNFIIKKIIVNKKMQLNKIILIQKAFRKYSRNNDIHFIKKLRKVFQDFKDTNDKNYTILPKSTDKKKRVSKTIFNKKKLLLKNNNNSNTLFFKIKDRNISLLKDNKTSIDAFNIQSRNICRNSIKFRTIEIEINNSNKDNDIDNYFRKTLPKNLPVNNHKNIYKTSPNRKLINSKTKINLKNFNYTYIHKNINRVHLTKENKKKLVNIISTDKDKNKNSKVYHKKKYKFFTNDYIKISEIGNNSSMKIKKNEKTNKHKKSSHIEIEKNNENENFELLKKYFINDSQEENKLVIRNNQTIKKPYLTQKKA